MMVVMVMVILYHIMVIMLMVLLYHIMVIMVTVLLDDGSYGDSITR